MIKKLAFILPCILSSAGSFVAPLSSNFQIVKKANDNNISSDQLKQFDINDYDNLGISTESVCSNDIGIAGYSCVSADLSGLNINKLIYGLNLYNDKVITLTDDFKAKQAFIYVYRSDIDNDYSTISLSTRANDYYDYDFINDKYDSSNKFVDYSLKPVSISSDYHFIKYLINGNFASSNSSFWNNQRYYVVRELLTNEDNVLDVAMQYSTNNNYDYVQNELNYFTAEQFLYDNWFRVNTGTKYSSIGLFLGGIVGYSFALADYISHDNEVAQQNILLFNLTDNQANKVDLNLRAVKVYYRRLFQIKGYTNLTSTPNVNQADNFLSLMPEGWNMAQDHVDSEHYSTYTINASQTIIKTADEVQSISIPTSILNMTQKKYTWQGLGKVSDYIATNKKSGVINTDKLNTISKYNYYTILDTTFMRTVYSGWGNNYGFGVGEFLVGGSKNQKNTTTGKYELPTYYEGVSLTEFYYEDNGELKKGIVVANYNNTYGAINVIGVSSTNNDLITKIMIIVIAVIAILLLSLLANTIGFLKPIFGAIISIIKMAFKLVFWILKLPYTIIKKLTSRKNKDKMRFKK